MLHRPLGSILPAPPLLWGRTEIVRPGDGTPDVGSRRKVPLALLPRIYVNLFAPGPGEDD